MAQGDPYATPAELEVRLGRSDDGTFTSLLRAASRAVEDFTGRQFNRDTSGTPVATARRFRAVDPQRLPVDDFHTTTDLAVTVDGTAWAVTDVDPRPWNGVHRGMTGWPYFDLVTVAKSWPPTRRATVTVTAHWGWAAVPEGIRLAALDVAEIMAQRGGETSGVVRSEAMDGYAVTYAFPQLTSGSSVPSGLVKAAPYRLRRFGVA
jgi:hypothetical protein